ncbi:CDP-glycerol glycerophosphotransferase [Actinocorallia herbida]|uniref:CDP-glycerol glycerophosphotransferase n=1 Tax=Actinocorallia herbida TaxID=58109 RepID=A0A3N1D9G9_9ACTN|nr:CDP-glycerol glycerophosphotransferase family protein [Actinocorallia herbida]ROO90187.1 CDP-glycerol glycerophosphotransferase [Actinocorallia herbida]
MPPVLSVVVAFTASDGLGDTLAALAAAGTGIGTYGTGLRVVMVDAGALDGADTVAKEYAAADERFALVRGEAGEAPRNVGVRHATGSYLAFADPGDLVSPGPLVASLERTGSDLALGRAAGVRYPDGLFTTARTELSLKSEPLLLHHRTLGAKVFRRSFWDRHGLSFRDGPEADLLLVAAAHTLAGRTDVLPDLVHGHPAPVSRDPVALLGALAEASAHLAAHAPRQRAEFDRSAVIGELTGLLHAVAQVEEGREDLFEAAHAYLSTVSRDLFHHGPVAHRMRCHLTAEGLLEEFLEVTRYEQAWGTRAGVIQRGILWRTWYHHYPQLFDNRVPQELLRAAQEMTFAAGVDEVEHVHGSLLRITGHAYVELLDLSGTGDGELRLTLVEAGGRRRVPVDHQRVDRPDLTARSAQAAAAYRGGGFAAIVDAARLDPGEWRLEAVFAHRGVRRTAFVAGPADLRRAHPAGVRVGAGLWAQPVCAGTFALRVRPLRALVTGCSVEDGDLVLTGWSPEEDFPLLAGSAEAPLELTGEDGFRARVPLAVLGGSAGTGELPLRLGSAPLTAGDLPPVASCGLVLRRDEDGLLALARRPAGPRVLRAEPEGATGVLLSGDLGTGLWLRHTGTGELRALPCDADGDVPVRYTELVPIRGGEWDLVDVEGTAATIDRAAAGRLPGPRRCGRAEYDLRVTARDGLRLRIRPGLRDEERGGFHQRRLAEQHYPRLRGRPLFDRVVFEASEGTRCSGSPRALYEALRERRPDLDLLWIARDASFAVPDGADCVVRDSAEHYAALATSRWVVGDGLMPEWFRKREGQVYVQTWHGAPLAGLGFDPREPRGFAEAARQERIAADVAQWDHLVSPNAYSTQILRNAFEYDGPIVESGYPRNDVLAALDLTEASKAARARLGLPSDARVILHDRALDVAALRAEVEPGTVFLAAADRDPTDLCLAADLLVTGVSALMFDFAVTGRPVYCHRPVWHRKYFDVVLEGPGPVLDDLGDLAAALRDPCGSSAGFAARFCPLDDGLASARVLGRVFDRPRDDRVFGVSRKKRKRKAR